MSEPPPKQCLRCHRVPEVHTDTFCVNCGTMLRGLSLDEVLEGAHHPPNAMPAHILAFLASNQTHLNSRNMK